MVFLTVVRFGGKYIIMSCFPGSEMMKMELRTNMLMCWPLPGVLDITMVKKRNHLCYYYKYIIGK
jgi:hypothetical protein